MYMMWARLWILYGLEKGNQYSGNTLVRFGFVQQNAYQQSTNATWGFMYASRANIYTMPKILIKELNSQPDFVLVNQNIDILYHHNWASGLSDYLCPNQTICHCHDVIFFDFLDFDAANMWITANDAHTRARVRNCQSYFIFYRCPK